MTNSGKRRPPLVADRRYPAKPAQKTVAKKAVPKKTVSRTKTPPKPRRKPVKRRGPLGLVLAPFKWLAGIIWAVSWRFSMAVALVIAGFSLYFASQMPPIEQLVDARARGSVTMTDFQGETFAWRGDQFGGMITSDTSPVLTAALVASEDKRFYRHFGISPRGIASAVRINLQAGRGPLSGNGGSTITQQTAKLLCLGVPFDPSQWEDEAAYENDCRQGSIWRKAKEAVYAIGMEIAYSKDEIITIYLNRAYLGAGARGFEAAAERYFSVPAAELSAAQAAMLVGLLPAPSAYAPTRNLSVAQGRGNLVIGLMEDQGRLSRAEAEQARANPATLSDTARANAATFFADWVMRSGPEFFTRETTEDVIIRTTLDRDIQQAAEDALLSVFENQVREGSEAQAAIVVMSADGAVRAMVGGRNLGETGAFNRATQAKRQTGSLFKPFIYAAALESGFSPNDLIDDTPVCWQVRGSGNWCPQNYDREFKGPITLTQALAESRNIPAIVLSEDVGRDAVRTVATQFGIESDLAAGPALALGVSESTLLEMTGAFAGILNGGSSVTPYGLLDLRFQGDAQPVMDATGSGIGERVIRQEAARRLTWMMSRVIAEGTGQRARLDGWEIAGKTGTTNAARDAWFIGFTGDYVTGVWMGYDDNTPLTGVTGGGLPADIWRETMSRVLSGRQPTALPMQAPTPRQNNDVLAREDAPVLERTILDVLDMILRDQLN